MCEITAILSEQLLNSIFIENILGKADTYLICIIYFIHSIFLSEVLRWMNPLEYNKEKQLVLAMT